MPRYEKGTDHPHYRHGMINTRTYYSWQNMVQRCTNPKNTNFKHYGARGITVCERWRLFENFLEDMGERPAGTTLERKENDLGYAASNCKWAARKEQDANKRIRKDNKTGIKGVAFLPRTFATGLIRIEARVRVSNWPKVLYYGDDFFEACCSIKSWEANHKEIYECD